MSGEHVRLIEEYKENAQRITALRSALKNAGAHMATLGNQLQRDPMRVTVEGGEFSITDEFFVSNMGRFAAIKYQAISIDTIGSNLSELQRCVERKKQIEIRLQAAGLHAHTEEYSE